ncbi:hypothetical protein ERICIV_04178 [Paenibacillus larvae subsp. larvae]|uniref:TIGR02679 family protein n=2 Tax=Paenibacillus larvae TaxID=1464 RepID=A0A2L1UJ97_9BACL|nr:TIGR02679 domain-containing protein [Paenibacillus larvae]AQT84738.1 hypothetical protein B1222_10585 [Paenibacillus larvae subsp. pulvifaciens]AQZ46733.1 hypothetical protein B5S25_09045 [Paenibacillus larvae subsp. pulvifaciens]AVF28492.1 hypothetical protein ERICIII_04433 [Paenibacillus larvae subsp. larvae]AVF32997.1 hypothetical protein ERICIV_04178 [Paenibacillus larvae subsp. larvae]MBH0342347.1 hypothetical protein [Paenibacillus larvae]
MDINQTVFELKKDGHFTRLFQLFVSRYESYGSFGNVRFKAMPEEHRSIASFLREYKPLPPSGMISVSSKKFQKAIDRSKYRGIELHELLEAYFGKPLITKREEVESASHKRKDWLLAHRQSCQTPECLRLLNDLLSNSERSKRIELTYKRDESAFKQIFPYLCTILSKMPIRPIVRLPIFSSHVTGNPHSLDRGKLLRHILIDVLIWKEEGTQVRSELNAEDEVELLFRHGILQEDMNNKITVIGLLATKDGKECRKLKGAYEDRSYLDLSLRDISRFSTCVSVNNYLYIVENPVVFSAILDYFEGKGRIPSVVCTYGQPRLSALQLLDRVVASAPSITLMYSGDFDPEGVMMANRTLLRYPQNAVPWRYSIADYEETAPSTPIEDIARLNQLNQVGSTDLILVAKAIMERQMAGYQEELIPLLIKDIESNLVMIEM